MGSWSRWALLLSSAAGLGYAFHVYSVSPATVPLHYGPAGVPDRWGAPSELLTVHLCLLGIGTALFLALPSLLRVLPPSLVNLPNKDYWLSADHRAEASAKFAVWCHVLGTGVNLLVVALQAALTSGPSQEGSALPLLLVFGFLAFTIGACVWLTRAFRLPARAE